MFVIRSVCADNLTHQQFLALYSLKGYGKYDERIRLRELKKFKVPLNSGSIEALKHGASDFLKSKFKKNWLARNEARDFGGTALVNAWKRLFAEESNIYSDIQFLGFKVGDVKPDITMYRRGAPDYFSDPKKDHQEAILKSLLLPPDREIAKSIVDFTLKAEAIRRKNRYSRFGQSLWRFPCLSGDPIIVRELLNHIKVSKESTDRIEICKFLFLSSSRRKQRVLSTEILDELILESWFEGLEVVIEKYGEHFFEYSYFKKHIFSVEVPQKARVALLRIFCRKPKIYRPIFWGDKKDIIYQNVILDEYSKPGLGVPPSFDLFKVIADSKFVIDVRIKAVEILGVRGQYREDLRPLIVGRLSGLKNNDNLKIREAATIALGQITEIKDKDKELQAWSASAGEKTLERMKDMLRLHDEGTKTLDKDVRLYLEFWVNGVMMKQIYEEVSKFRKMHAGSYPESLAILCDDCDKRFGQKVIFFNLQKLMIDKGGLIVAVTKPLVNSVDGLSSEKYLIALYSDGSIDTVGPKEFKEFFVKYNTLRKKSGLSTIDLLEIAKIAEWAKIKKGLW